MRVLCMNIHKGFTPCNRRFMLQELRNAVRTTRADVVLLQEVLGADARPRTFGTSGPPQYEFLADEMWPQYAYGRNAVYPAGHHGNAVLSKYPIIHHCNLDASQFRAEKRGLLHCTVRLPASGQHVFVVNVHLGLSERHRRAQTQTLCDSIWAHVPARAALVVAGDFNDWRLRAHAMLVGKCGLADAFGLLDLPVPRTFPARWPVLRLDRIYVRNVELRRASVLSERPWSHLSDHAPLLVDLCP